MATHIPGPSLYLALYHLSTPSFFVKIYMNHTTNKQGAFEDKNK